ncbi:MAG: helix-turn-helix transcriptional regulator [Archaeoglobus sp.]|nr:helix-turn-helix transcriptional regulator [Archaeoglobus sp.]
MTEESWSKFMDSLEKNEEYHRRYHAAVANPVRRKILSLIAKGLNKSEIMDELKLSEQQLDYHLRLLEHGFCIKRDGDSFKLTKEGEIVHYLVKEKSKF